MQMAAAEPIRRKVLWKMKAASQTAKIKQWRREHYLIGMERNNDFRSLIEVEVTEAMNPVPELIGKK